MYLHIGGDHVIALADVIAVVDAKALSQSLEAPDFLAKAKAQGIFVDTKDEKTNSYVVTTRGVYASAISATTLKRRAANPQSMLEWE